MISSVDTREFMPYGRDYLCNYSNKIQPLVTALRDFSINGTTATKDKWLLREYQAEVKEDDCDEELYTNGNTVVWSKGTTEGGGRVIKSFTLDTPVQQALWSSMLLPAEDPTAPPTVQDGVVVIDDKTLNMFTTNGKDYKTTLPFPISKAWSIKNGMLFAFENKSSQPFPQNGIPQTPQSDKKGLPVLYSMLHPLDEVAPVICKTGKIGRASCRERV